LNNFSEGSEPTALQSIGEIVSIPIDWVLSNAHATSSQWIGLGEYRHSI